jgi:hypothetical protein
MTPKFPQKSYDCDVLSSARISRKSLFETEGDQVSEKILNRPNEMNAVSTKVLLRFFLQSVHLPHPYFLK